MWVVSCLRLFLPAVRAQSLVKKETGKAPKPVFEVFEIKVLVLLGIKL
jgi:hypothetical protein